MRGACRGAPRDMPPSSSNGRGCLRPMLPPSVLPDAPSPTAHITNPLQSCCIKAPH